MALVELKPLHRSPTALRVETRGAVLLTVLVECAACLPLVVALLWIGVEARGAMEFATDRPTCGVTAAVDPPYEPEPWEPWLTGLGAAGLGAAIGCERTLLVAWPTWPLVVAEPVWAGAGTTAGAGAEAAGEADVAPAPVSALDAEPVCPVAGNPADAEGAGGVAGVP